MTTEGLPAVELGDAVGSAEEILSGLRRIIIQHPAACQELFSALRAEGERYIETAEGLAAAQTLSHSDLIRRARFIWESSSGSILDEHPDGILPSSYIDALFMTAAEEIASPNTVDPAK